MQWAVATPLGALTVVMLAALAAGFPLALVFMLLYLVPLALTLAIATWLRLQWMPS